jgi:lipopolysaccharide export system permease protein
MSILDKYLLKEFLRNWYGITSILLLILISDNLAGSLALAIKGVIDSSVVLPLFIANAFQFSVALIPLGLFLGIMLGMGRLYHDSEMASAYACGLSPKQLLRPAFFVGVIGFLIVSILAFSVAPWAARTQSNIIEKQSAKQEIDKIEAGRFNLSKDNKTVIFAETKQGAKLESVFVKSRSKDDEVGLEFSQTVNIAKRFEDQYKYFIFETGSAYNDSDDEISITSYKEHGVLLESKITKHKRVKVAGISTMELINSTSLEKRAELHWRMAVSISTIMLAMLALPLSHTAPRKGRYSRLVVALFVYLIYVNLLIFAQKLMENGTVPDWVGMWWVHILCFSLVFYLNWKRQKYG